MINRGRAQKPKGYIARYGLEDWYLSLSDDTRIKVKLYASEPRRVDKGTPDVIVLCDREDTAQEYLGDIGERAAGFRVGDAPKDPLFAEYMFKVALEASGDHPITRHFIYTSLTKLLYKQRDVRTDAIEQCIKYCLEDIDRIEEFVTASSLEEYELYMKMTTNGYIDDLGEFSMSNIPSFPSFDRLRIIYEKAGDYSSAISVVERAQTVGAYQHEYAEKLIVKLQKKVSAAQKRSNKEKTIGTTVDELEGLCVVKSILREVLDVNRIVQRNQQNYFAILLDDNNRKPLCRLWFNSKQKYISLFDAEKNEEKIAIDIVDDIYKYADKLRAKAQGYA